MDVPLLAFDIAGNVVSVVLPGVLWAVLFYVAWEHGPFAESVGLGRRAFWLLLPGALLASYAILPIAPVSVDWVAVDLGGAVFPLIVGAYAMRRYAAPFGRSLARFLALLGVESAVLLALVWPSNGPAWTHAGSALHLGSDGASIVGVALVAALATAIVVLLGRRVPSGVPDRVGYLFGLTSAVLVATYAGSSAIPGVGIQEAFPYFLLPPTAVGVAAVLVAPRVFPGEEGFALPAAFFASTLGVLLGADLLRQPPLYGTGGGGLYAIGGAGVLDLVYLSGLLALAGAGAAYLRTGRGWNPVGPRAPAPEPSPLGRLRAAYRAGVAGELSASIAASVGAARAAAAQARRLLGAGPAPDDRPWEGLPVPGWIVSDHANLEALARSGTADPREGYRAWLTARWLVLVGAQLSQRRFASIGTRLAAFGIDLAVVTAPAIVAFAAIARATPGGLIAVAQSLPFNTAIVGFIATALLYFVVAEGWFGATVGKAALGIEVRDRRLGIPDGLSALVRNAPLAPVLTVIGIGGALAMAIALKGPRGGAASLYGIAVPSSFATEVGVVAFIAGGVVLLGTIGVLAMALTTERQRIGDLWAETWVVTEARSSPAVRPPSGDPSARSTAGRSE